MIIFSNGYQHSEENKLKEVKKLVTSLKVETRSAASPDIISLLQKTIFGTKGKVRYRLAEGMASQANLEFIQIRKGNQVLVVS